MNHSVHKHNNSKRKLVACKIICIKDWREIVFCRFHFYSFIFIVVSCKNKLEKKTEVKIRTSYSFASVTSGLALVALNSWGETVVANSLKYRLVWWGSVGAQPFPVKWTQSVLVAQTVGELLYLHGKSARCEKYSSTSATDGNVPFRNSFDCYTHSYVN